jgi:hypothetical protein
MPFLETCRMEQRIRMQLDDDTGAWNALGPIVCIRRDPPETA